MNTTPRGASPLVSAPSASADVPVSRSPVNPVIPGFHPDPTVCCVGSDYWLATSSFEYFPAIPIFHSHDLVNWTLRGHALARPEQLDLRGRRCSHGLFAPTLRYHQGTFYLTCTDVGGRGNFLLTTTDPAGSWSDPQWINEGELAPWFDPSLCFAPDGQIYYTRRHAFEVWQGVLDPRTARLSTPLRKIAGSFTGDDIEGPHLYYRKPYYYLLAAEGGTGWGHAITCARARDPWGPFEPCPFNPLLTHRHLVNHEIRSVGHGDLVEAHDGSWWILLLATRHGHFGGQPYHHLGRETFLARVTWEDGWPIINRGKPLKRETPVPAFAKKPMRPAPLLADPFAGPTLPPAWVCRRYATPGAWTLGERPGCLRLYPRATTLDDAEPESFVGHRVDAPRFTVSVDLEYTAGTNSDAAGLALVLADDCHAELMIRREANGCVARLEQRALSLRGQSNGQALGAGPWKLQLEGDWRGFTFAVEDAGGQRHAFPQIDRRLLTTELAGGWTGLMVGLYATTTASADSAPADFRHYLYTRLPDA